MFQTFCYLCAMFFDVLDIGLSPKVYFGDVKSTKVA